MEGLLCRVDAAEKISRGQRFYFNISFGSMLKYKI